MTERPHFRAWPVQQCWTGQWVVTLPDGERPSIHETLCAAAWAAGVERSGLRLVGWGGVAPNGTEPCPVGCPEGECGCWEFVSHDELPATHAVVEARWREA